MSYDSFLRATTTYLCYNASTEENHYAVIDVKSNLPLHHSLHPALFKTIRKSTTSFSSQSSPPSGARELIEVNRRTHKKYKNLVDTLTSISNTWIAAMAKSIDASPPRKSGRPLGRVRGSKLINGKVFSPGDELPKPRGFLPGPKVVVVKVNPLSEGPKRGRGRPRKSHNEIDLQVNEDGDDGAELGDDEDSMVVKETEIDAMVIDEGNTRPTNITKRGRGRPPKNTAVHTPAKTPLNPGQAVRLSLFLSPYHNCASPDRLTSHQLNVNLNESDQSIHQVKRSRGRPRKFALSTGSYSPSQITRISLILTLQIRHPPPWRTLHPPLQRNGVPVALRRKASLAGSQRIKLRLAPPQSVVPKPTKSSPISFLPLSMTRMRRISRLRTRTRTMS